MKWRLIRCPAITPRRSSPWCPAWADSSRPDWSGPGGSTPVWSVIRHLGIPLVSTGVGKLTARTHSVNENIKIEDLIKGAKYMAAILDEFSRT